MLDQAKQIAQVLTVKKKGSIQRSQRVVKYSNYSDK